MKDSKFKIVCENSCSYQFNIKSCNPSDPVMFKQKKKKGKKEWKNELNEYIGGPARGSDKHIIETKRTDGVETKFDQNPIRVEVMSITSDQGEPTGSNAVLYGYYMMDGDKQKINFYWNREQSSAHLDFTVAINQDDSTIVLE